MYNQQTDQGRIVLRPAVDLASTDPRCQMFLGYYLGKFGEMALYGNFRKLAA